MSKERQKQVIKNLGKCRSEEEAITKAGYSKSYARAGQIKKTKTWQELMDKYLPDDKLAKVHQEGLDASIKRFKKNISTGEVEIVSDDPDYAVRHKYLDTGYKLKGSYAPEKKSIDLNLNDKDKAKTNKAVKDALS